MEIKKAALIGMGSMGAFFAPRLWETLGKNFWLIAGGERKHRLETQGVTINGTCFHFPVCAPEDAAEAADLIIIATKEMGLTAALSDIRGFVGPKTLLLPVLNGIESEERAAAVYGWEHVLYSYMRIAIAMKDGKADFNPDGGFVYFGEKENKTRSERVEAVATLFSRCGIPYKIPEDMLQGLWFKFMCNIGENMTCALLGVPYGAFRDSEDANFIRREAMKEVAAIAERLGIFLGEREFAIQEESVRRIAPGNKPSTLQDLEAGRPTEVAMFAGTVVRLGRELGIPTPFNALFYHGIRVLEQKNRGLIEGI